MKIEDPASEALIEELAAAAEGVVVSLRLNEGLPEQKRERLSSALSQAARQWSETPYVPKRLAAILVELYPAVEASSHLYAGGEAVAIQQAAAEVYEQCMHILGSE